VGEAGIALALQQTTHVEAQGLLGFQGPQFPPENQLAVWIAAQGGQLLQGQSGGAEFQAAQGSAAFIEDPKVLLVLQGLEDPGHPFRPVELRCEPQEEAFFLQGDSCFHKPCPEDRKAELAQLV
jgi:hypothetical protein